MTRTVVGELLLLLFLALLIPTTNLAAHLDSLECLQVPLLRLKRASKFVFSLVRVIISGRSRSRANSRSRKNGLQPSPIEDSFFQAACAFDCAAITHPRVDLLTATCCCCCCFSSAAAGRRTWNAERGGLKGGSPRLPARQLLMKRECLSPSRRPALLANGRGDSSSS